MAKNSYDKKNKQLIVDGEGMELNRVQNTSGLWLIKWVMAKAWGPQPRYIFYSQMLALKLYLFI